MNDCIFCKIVSGEIPSYKVYEDDEFFAFLDISEFTPGHTLVIPREHYRYIWDIENISGYSQVIKKICNHYTKELGYQFVDTLSFGRMVPHAHMHLVPHNGDNVDWKKALKEIGEMQSDSQRRLTKERGEELVKKFRLTTEED